MPGQAAAVIAESNLDVVPHRVQISECARLIRASSSIAGTGLMSVSPPATLTGDEGCRPL